MKKTSKHKADKKIKKLADDLNEKNDLVKCPDIKDVKLEVITL